MNRILLIGNGPSAIATKRGKDIDAFDGDVARFNVFHIDGYEAFVGKRTDVWITVASFKSRINLPYKKVFCFRFEADPHFKAFEDLRSAFGDKFSIIPHNVIDDVFAISGYRGMSTGAMATMYCLSNGYESISIHGFDFLNPDVPHHYADKGKPGNLHKPELERRFFKTLIQRGQVNLF